MCKSKTEEPTNPAALSLQAENPQALIEHWRTSTLNVLLTIVSIAILPALLYSVYRIFIKQTILGDAFISCLFYACLLYLAFFWRNQASIWRSWVFVGLTFLTGVLSLGRGGLAGDGLVYLTIVPLLAFVLIGKQAGIYTAIASLATYAVLAILAQNGLLGQFAIYKSSPLSVEYWLNSGLTMTAIVISTIYVTIRFYDFQFHTLESSQEISRKLRDAYRQIEAAKQALEQRVEQRTQELMRANRRLEFMATHDNLTGLPNRLLLYDRMDQAIKKAQRQGTEFAVFFVDVDDFKKVNDTFGHAVGDQILQIVSGLLLHSVRASDTVSRLAGDEFALVLDEIARPEDIEMVAKKICAALSQPIEILDKKLTITVSLGVSLYPKHGSNPDSLLRRADQAMYVAKSAGKNTYRLAE